MKVNKIYKEAMERLRKRGQSYLSTYISWGLADSDTDVIIRLVPEAANLIEKNEFGYYTRISRVNYNKIMEGLKRYLPPGFDYETDPWGDLDKDQFDAANSIRRLTEFM